MAAGTSIPSGATMFWVYPVSNETELDVPRSLKIVNLIVPKAPKLKANQTYSFSATAKVGDSLSMTNEGGGDLLSCVFSEDGLAPAAFEVAVSSDKSTCVIKVGYVVLAGVTYNVQVQATNDVGESLVTATLIQVARISAPALINETITFASSDPAGTKKRVTNNGGGNLTSCTAMVTKNVPQIFTVGISDDKATCIVELFTKPTGAYQETIVIQAVNDVDDSVASYSLIRNAPGAPDIQDESFVYAHSDAAGTTKTIRNSGGGELTGCYFTKGPQPEFSLFEVQISASGDTCEIIRGSATTNYGASGTFAVAAENAAGTDVSYVHIELLPPPPELEAPTDNQVVLSDVSGKRSVVINNIGGVALTNCFIEESPVASVDAFPFTVARDDANEHCVISLTESSPEPQFYYVRVWAQNAVGTSAKVSMTVDVQDPPAGLRIFVTNSQFTGDLTVYGMPASGADQKCDGDANKPAGGGDYKALIGVGFSEGQTEGQVGVNRFPCIGGACGGDSSFDWVLQPNTTYINKDGAVIGVTNSNAYFEGNLTNQLQAADADVWTGIENVSGRWEPSPWNCNHFSVTENWTRGWFGKASQSSFAQLIMSSNSAPSANCDTSKRFYCVEQPVQP